MVNGKIIAARKMQFEHFPRSEIFTSAILGFLDFRLPCHANELFFNRTLYCAVEFIVCFVSRDFRIFCLDGICALE